MFLRTLSFLWLLCLLLVACDANSPGIPDAGGALPDVIGVTDTAALDSFAPDQSLDAGASEPEVFVPPLQEGTCLLRRDWKENANGPFQCHNYEYDPLGNQILGSTDDECVGARENCSGAAYDNQSRVLKRFDDRDCDGTPDGQCYDYSYDDALRQMSWVRDDECDGIPDSRYTETYDAEGRLIAERHEGGWFFCIYYTYDEQGNLTEKRWDTRCDGTADQCEVTAYDDLGWPTSSYSDELCDGVPSGGCRTVEYEVEDGVVTRYSRSDSDCDGQDDACSVSVTDEENRWLRLEHDEGCDGVGETCRTREFDALGSLVGMTIAEPCSAQPEHCAESYTLDENGWEIASQQDPECSGQPRHCVETEYDVYGRPVFVRFDGGCAGVGLLCREYVYDAYGNLVEYAHEYDCEEGPYLWERWEYECTPLRVRARSLPNRSR